jgi:ribA/ribD-fused uncharacterized protein
MLGERVTDTHIYFWGGIFSQWYDCKFVEDRITFTSAEQYMMYHKAKAFNDYGSMFLVMDTTSPREQKAIGRAIKGYSDEIWGPIRYATVVQGNYLKFTQNEDLKALILSTGNKHIVEASPYDKVWGIGLGPADDKVLDESKWDGQNLLGKAVMEVRDRIRFENGIFLT